jgi:N-dimethylarginine dimethylaminohydrolase
MATSEAGTLIALTHVPSPNMQRGERTFVDEAHVDYELALRQHASYRGALQQCGAEVIVLDVNRTMPDCVFIEDTAVVLRELA